MREVEFAIAGGTKKREGTGESREKKRFPRSSLEKKSSWQEGKESLGQGAEVSRDLDTALAGAGGAGWKRTAHQKQDVSDSGLGLHAKETRGESRHRDVYLGGQARGTLRAPWARARRGSRSGRVTAQRPPGLPCLSACGWLPELFKLKFC